MICLCCTDWTKYADNTEVVHSYKGWPIRPRHSRPDVLRWGMRLRLHPIDNGCEKNLLFTSQMYETTELAALSEEISG